MSGGSYNYAYRRFALGEIGEVAAGRFDFQRMAEDMATAGYPEAAAPLAAIVARIDALDAWAQGMSADGLPELMKAFEWWKSCDSAEQDFRAAVDEYLWSKLPVEYTPEVEGMNRYRTAADIVRKLAAIDPMTVEQSHWWSCVLCEGGAVAVSPLGFVHAPDCIWLRAQAEPAPS